MQVADPSPELLRRLVDEGGSALTMSLYLDFDPSRASTPAARQTEIDSALDEARREVEEFAAESDHEQKMALRALVDRARGELAETDFAGIHGLALFAGLDGLFEAVRLPAATDRVAVVAPGPWIEPLAGSVTAERIAALLVSRRETRLLVGTRDHLEEAGAFSDDVHGRIHGKGLAPDEMQSSVSAEWDRHLERTGRAVFRAFQAAPFDRLWIGCTNELRPEVERHLHDYVARRVAGHFEPQVDYDNVDVIARELEPLLEAHDRTREAEALDTLKARLGRDGQRAAAGREAVRAALAQSAVATLLYDPAVDVETELEHAVQQAADLLPIRHHPDLGPHEGIAALLRF